jgi:apolipoprotein D and lipocalin family protein
MRVWRWSWLLAGPVLLAGCGTAPQGPVLETVPYVDLNRYLGTWYEIATIPQSFQRGCTGVTANYSLRPDGQIKVVNTCRPERLDAPQRQAEGRAWVVDPATNAKLKVSFFLWFAGDYWIIELGKEYDYAVIGHPERKYLWVLCRQPRMDESLYSAIVERLKTKGYDVSLLKRTPQPE